MAMKTPASPARARATAMAEGSPQPRPATGSWVHLGFWFFPPFRRPRSYFPQDIRVCVCVLHKFLAERFPFEVLRKIWTRAFVEYFVNAWEILEECHWSSRQEWLNERCKSVYPVSYCLDHFSATSSLTASLGLIKYSGEYFAATAVQQARN